MITLQVNESTIRMMETDGSKLLSWGSRPLEPGIFREGILEEPDSLGKAIKELAASNRIKEKKVTVGLSGLYALTRILIIPTPPSARLTDESVLEAVENILPIAEEEIYLSWESISMVEGGQQVMIHTVPREMIDGTIQALKTAGLSSQQLYLTPVALARATNTDESLILNIENSSYDVIMVVDGMAEVIRTSAWNPEDMSDEEINEYFVTAVETTVSFFDSSRPGLPFRRTNPLFISGELSKDTGLVNGLRNQLEFAEGSFSSPFEHTEDFPVAEYAGCLGLAAKELKQEQISGYVTPEINLLPERYKPWRPSKKQAYAGLAFFLMIIILSQVYQVALGAMDDTAKLDREYKSLNSLMQLRMLELAKRDPLIQVVDEYEIIKNMNSGFIKDYETIIEIADNLNVTLSAISHSGSGISFSCQTDDYQVFRDFIGALEESGRFGTIKIPTEGYPYIKSGNVQIQK